MEVTEVSLAVSSRMLKSMLEFRNISVQHPNLDISSLKLAAQVIVILRPRRVETHFECTLDRKCKLLRTFFFVSFAPHF